MALGRRYFILEESLPASDIPKILGRVVVNKLLPMHHSYAPFPPEKDEPRHNAEDIIPNILPDPSIWPNRKDFLTHTSDWKIRGGLANVLGIENSHENKKGVSLKSEELKCYALSNTARHFKILMGNELFARDVCELLKDSRRSHAYFVVGFLTTKGAHWTEFATRSRRAEFDVTAPVLEAIGSPLQGIGDPQIAPGFGTSETYRRTMKIEDERIFAMAYDIVKTSYKFEMSPRKFVQSNFIDAGPIRASAKYLAFSNDSDEEEEDDDDDDDDGVVGSGGNNTKAKPREQMSGASVGVELVDIQEFPTAEELCENEEWSTPSFNL
jgi:hypothetical protein